MNHAETSIAMFPGREIPVLEWSDGESRPPILMLAGSGAASDWGALATGLATDYRILALERAEWPLLMEAIWASGEPAILVAQGDAAEAAIQVASVAPGSVRAAVLVDYALPDGAASPVKLAMPCLIFRGRQSDITTHGRRGGPARGHSGQPPDRAGKLPRVAGRRQCPGAGRVDPAIPVAAGRAIC